MRKDWEMYLCVGGGGCGLSSEQTGLFILYPNASPLIVNQTLPSLTSLFSRAQLRGGHSENWPYNKKKNN